MSLLDLLRKRHPIEAQLADITKRQKTIMKTQADVALELRDATDQLTRANDKLSSAVTGVAKIGTETDAILAEVQRLTDLVNNQPGGASQELVDAVTALRAQVDRATGTVAEVSAGLTTVDEKVPDAQTPAPPANP